MRNWPWDRKLDNLNEYRLIYYVCIEYIYIYIYIYMNDKYASFG
ncbi:hypothetical protein ACMBCM_08640 [Spiroplasma sp. K1]